MRWLEVRPHSLTKKNSARGRGSHLSAEGVVLARLVGESLGPFASVVTSASPRAIETAVAMGFAVDDTVELPSGYVPGEGCGTGSTPLSTPTRPAWSAPARRECQEWMMPL
jgi:hypothetical protein